ncbi:MAG: NADPH-dependent oxidoreductase [Clostridiales Family XIII bacterium]|jgi:nitroreductase|nr:NADPH-dependent oxidoreductase [Clostridiales Family XIII bacterium]
MKAISETIGRQLAHRSVREFTDRAVPEEVLGALFEVMNRTATSTGLQSYSVIRVTDAGQRRRVAEVCGQEYVARATELFIFVADAYRNGAIARAKGYDGEEIRDMDRFFQGFTDAALAAQNLTNAVESLGMGAVYFGSILNDSRAIIEILGLPKHTFPVVGVGFGYPAQEPQLKPRMPISVKVFENRYELPEDFEETVAAYDEEMRGYYDTRANGRRSDSFSDQLVARLENTIDNRAKMLRVVREQGFELGV